MRERYARNEEDNAYGCNAWVENLYHEHGAPERERQGDVDRERPLKKRDGEENDQEEEDHEEHVLDARDARRPEDRGKWVEDRGGREPEGEES